MAANGSELTLQDGTKISADAFIYCTGYLYEFPFLNESSGIFIEGTKHVRPLYKYILNVKHPSMAFIGLPYLYTKGPFFYSQVIFFLQYINCIFVNCNQNNNFKMKFFVNLLRGKITLPSYEAMIEDSERLPPKMPAIDGDKVHDPQWDYYDDLAREGGFKPMPSFYEKTAKLSFLHSAKHVDFKDFDLNFSDNGDPIFVRRHQTS